MKHSKRKFVELAGFDARLFNDAIIDYMYKNIVGYMGGFSKLISHKFGMVALAMSISGVNTYQWKGNSDEFWQYLEVKGETGHCSMDGHVGGPNFR